MTKKVLPGWYTAPRTGTTHRIFEDRTSVCGLMRHEDEQWIRQLMLPWGFERRCKICEKRVGKYEDRINRAD